MENLISETLEKSLAFAKDKLAEFLTNPEFNQQIQLAFGDNVDTDLVRRLIQDLAENNSSIIPKIEIVDQLDINGASGGFSSTNQVIYLSQELLESNADNIQTVSTVLIEEIGHFIDDYVNSDDTPGDEGELFTGLVHNRNLNDSGLRKLQTENDNTTVVIDGEVIQLEQSISTFVNVNIPVGIVLGHLD